MATAPRNISFAERNKAQQPALGEVVTNIPVFEIPQVDTSRPSRFTFSDIKFEASDPSNDLATDREAIVQRIMLILGTNRRTRWRRPQYGANIEPLLFDPVDRVTAIELQRRIIEGLNDRDNGAGDIVVRNVEVLPNPDENQFFCNVVVDVPRLGLFNESVTFGLNSL